MDTQIEKLSSELQAMKSRLSETPQSIGGAYNRKYYALKANIKNKEALIDKLKWNKYLAK